VLLFGQHIYLLSYPTIKSFIVSIKRNNVALIDRPLENQFYEAYGCNRLVQLE
jgi:hypothetical protein